MQRIIAIALFTFSAALGSASIEARDVEVMVLGTYHLANPGQDLHNVEVDDVTAEDRQRELEALADALVTFAPDRVAVEATSDRDDLSLASYESFEPADLRENPNETVQIGFRLAHSLEHERVYGIDEQDEETDYFPFGDVAAFARANDQDGPIQALNRLGTSWVETIARMHAGGAIGSVLYWMNQPEMIDRMQAVGYYGLLAVGDAQHQPGARLNARYYERNARIFAKLVQVAEPGDRVLIVYGAGHSYWLRHFVSATPGFELVEPNPYLSVLTAQ